MNLKRLGIDYNYAMLCGNARKKYWHMSKLKWVAIALPEKYAGWLCNESSSKTHRLSLVFCMLSGGLKPQSQCWTDHLCILKKELRKGA